ncbi:MAG: DNA polymerase III subunit gamma/tau [Thermodesulfobacteriota bacterium]
MAERHLTATYRPQTFARVVGQDQLKKILSRSAAEEKIAPAYMFSGTRGVGKTTLARILAKALNCSRYPAPEPCNQCEFCRRITNGSSMDVAEIDGASHTGVDHIRKLNEEIGYSPLECRYKVIIIDEAHMLSKSAFNALLKTLEEPPRHAIFILATTEPHKFPQTIISRCQHYNFKRIRQKDMEQYLAFILEQESVAYDEQALKIIVRKGGGSVRDCLSALSQILALGRDRLELQEVRDILGVAGQEMMLTLVQALIARDCLKIMGLAGDLLDTGLDLGFFLQDLSTLWRNLFLLKQTGEQGADFLEMPAEESTELIDLAAGISLTRIHASWQLTLEGQRRVLTSADPGLALELLLLNLAYLSELMPLEQLKAESGPFEQKPPTRGNSSGRELAQAGDNRGEKSSVSQIQETRTGWENTTGDWQGFLTYFKSRQNGTFLPSLTRVKGELKGDTLTLTCPSFLGERLQEKDKLATLNRIASEYFKREITIRLNFEQTQSKPNPGDLKKKILENPKVKSMLTRFQARVIEVGPGCKSDTETR